MATVYIDTSVAINESFLRSPYVEAFLKACKILQYTVVIPEIVDDELKGNYPKKLGEKLSAFQKAEKDLGKLIDLDSNALTFSDAVDAYEEWLADLLEQHGVMIAPYPQISPKELVEQSYKLNKPFKNSGEGHKDYIVWKTILSGVINQEQPPPNLFLTNNTKDFCGDGSDGAHILHPDLAAQIENPDLRPRVYTSIKSAFDSELAPHLEGITLDAIPDLGNVDDLVEETLLGDLPGRTLYGLEGIPFSNEITISSVGLQSIDSVTLKQVDDEVVVKVIGDIEVEVDGFIDKSNYYMSEEVDSNMYVVDGNWNDHVMFVSSNTTTPFDLTLFYSLTSKEVTGSEITLPHEIEDEWPYK
ncbi:PIN domain-containing protein [Pelagerythrobacter rhizovicinus]|uniref:DUF4935 domain-containing protein n=1 Tax=Pelagerythrobacter rhizovicinus TaxID=2268576 RepID=A0A4Q2KPU3_9SPHN|nr:PIN domain-containing protein [Pelagerythrobacter rhizovicinus]RXZ65281.1 DUF4935 domain-containing protein [Pelagerythrobacter rhizovicinus]